jgi:2-keto-4-pentenoate hydratase/2-oxohepta-3-ene-1,7-dioic acid hydratase in catechol pathway
MRWLRFQRDGAAHWGALEGDRVRRYEGSPFDTPRATDDWHSVDGLHWLPPCQPGKIIGLWNNFRAAAEKNGWPAPNAPLYFLKSPASASGHLHKVPVPASYSGRVIYEGELAIVIGRECRGVTAEQARDHILGYSCANDFTALELLNADPSFPQWTRAKSFDGFAAFGPVIDTEFDPAGAQLRTLVGGRERQNFGLDDMFFAPAELVAHISQDMTLMPGDVIFCGTSLGVLPLKPGTQVDVAIEGLSTLTSHYI